MERCVVIDGMRVDVSEESEPRGVPLLFVNGMRMQDGIFRRLRERLSVTTISFNFPSEWKTSCILPSIGDFSDLMAKLVDALGYEQVDLLGVSWGGAPAITFALQHSKRLRKLILAATTPCPALLLFQPQVLRAYILGDYGGKMTHNQGLVREVKQEVQRASLMTDWYRGFALMGWNGITKLSQIPHQTLILSGTEDTIVSHREAEMLGLIPRSELCEIQDGHFFIWSSADEVATRIRAFL